MMRRANTNLDAAADAPSAPDPLVNLIVDRRSWALVLADAGLAPTSTFSGDPIDPFTGLPIRTTGDLIAMSPPLILSKAQIDVLVETLGAVLAKLD